MTTTYVAFNVTGEFVTEHARNLMIENKVREAERFLMECIIGMTHELVIKILKGESKIIGDLANNDLDVVDDDNQEMMEFIKREFGGIVNHRGKYWKPYAYVNGWGPKDVGAGEYHNHSLYNYGSIIPVGASKILAFSMSRNVAYMDDKQKDIQQILRINETEKHAVLWKEVNCPPYWIEIAQGSDWQKGLDNFLRNGGKLSERNHSNTFENLDIFSDIRQAVSEIEDNLTEDRIEEIEEFEDEEEIDKKLLSNLGVPEHVQSGLSKLLFGGDESEIEKPPKKATDVEIQHSRHGFILPNGDFYACEYHHHAQLAERVYKHIINKDFGEQQDKFGIKNDYEKAADADGWIRIQQSAISYDYNCVICKRPTAKQKSTFLYWAGMHGLGEDDLKVYHTYENLDE